KKSPTGKPTSGTGIEQFPVAGLKARATWSLVPGPWSLVPGLEEHRARSETRTIRRPELHFAGNVQEERPGREDAGLVRAVQERVLPVYESRFVEGQAHWQ